MSVSLYEIGAQENLLKKGWIVQVLKRVVTLYLSPMYLYICPLTHPLSMDGTAEKVSIYIAIDCD